MPNLPFFEDSTPPAIHAPRIKISVDSGEATGGFGGLVGAATDLLGSSGASSWADHTISLTVCQSFGPRVDYVDLLIADTEGAPEAGIDDTAIIALGSDEESEPVFSGSVIAIDSRGNQTRRYRLGNHAHTLAQARINQSVTNMSIQQAIEFAAAQFDVPSVIEMGGEDGTLLQYVFDDAWTVWDHITYLASLRGLNVWIDANNTIQIADQLAQRESLETYAWGQDLLEYQLFQRRPHSGAITALGNAQVEGEFILRKQSPPNTALLGDGTPQRFYRDGALQSQRDLSTRASAADLYAKRLTSQGEIVVPGSARQGPGQIITLSELPDGSDGPFLILQALHQIDHQTGWRAHLSVSKAEDSQDLLGALGSLL